MVSCGNCGVETDREPLCEECNDEDTAQIEKLRAENAELREDKDKLEQQSTKLIVYAQQLEARERGLRAKVRGFIAAVDAALAHHETKGKGGMRVPFHGDFANVAPSTLRELRWYKRNFESVLDQEQGGGGRG